MWPCLCCGFEFNEYAVNGKPKMYCSSKCRGRHNSLKSREKANNSYLNKHGYSHPFARDGKRNEIEAKWKIKYGCYPLQDEKIKDKIKQTNISLYGFENVFSSPVIKEKIKQTNLKNLGVECVLTSPTIKDKIKQTNISLYGVENVFLSDFLAVKPRPLGRGYKASVLN